MHTLRIPIVLAAAFLIAACFAVAGSGAPQSGKDADHNRKGLEYYSEAFHRQLPEGKQREADEYFDLAVGEFRAAIAANPRSAAAYRNLARVYYVREDFLQAADAYRTVTVLDPGDIDAYLLLALSYTRADRFAEALEALETARTMTGDPDVIAKLDGYIGKINNRGRD